MKSISVVLATKNEEGNIKACLESVKDLADEIIVFDEASSDKTVEIAEKYGATVTNYVHKTNFHETKQKAIDAAKCDWILQLDADERVTQKLKREIKEVVQMSYKELLSRTPETEKQKQLFERHQHLIEKRDGSLGKKTGEVVAFFIPRLNFFLGAPLRHAGVYPDGVIRLFERGKARLPGKSVHELMEVDGEVGWLFNDLEHHESPTFSRYLVRANRYTTLTAEEFKEKSVSTNLITFFHYSFFKPLFVFVKLYFLHKGFSDGMRGFVWSAFSALHYPIAYFKYWQMVKG
jgi:glycosyltransferase involved in cell wall biosynthesis